MSHVLQHVVLPGELDHEVLPLYVRADSGLRVDGRRSVTIEPGRTVSFASYFNAFPAAYWRRWAALESVTLVVDIGGTADVALMASDPDGRAHRVDFREATTGRIEFDTPLSGFADGGWLWFDVAASSEAVAVRDARWVATSAPRVEPRASVGITTFNKPDYCVATLSALAEDRSLDDVVERVIVVDQGDRRVEAEEGFAAAASALGRRLRLVRQPNLGGSGGYARVMDEVDRSSEPFALLMDDDVHVEPEAVRRAIVFAAYCSRPTIVGGHMLDLFHRTKLYAWAEVVDEVPFMWRAEHAERMPLDLAGTDLREEPLLHRPMEADYNGWWMCVIPREAITRTGLPLPAFIKWDDAEYALRARAQGIPTVTLPGVALWHMSWEGKDDHVDWQAYFHARNRIVTALLHSSVPRGGTLLVHSRRVDLKHVLSMQYYPVALRHTALEAVLGGPEHMHDDLRTALGRARALAAEFPETADAPADAAAPAAPPWPDDESDMPAGRRLKAFTLSALLSAWFHRPRGLAHGIDVALDARHARWWRLSRYDSALVTAAGSGRRHLYVRDRVAARRLLRESARLHRRLRREWPRLVQRYRAADLTSSRAWAHTFEAAEAR
ncbi:glycosyltransferase [Microbacterium awajiense]|uniref:Glycosyltransferase n=1 Tax=Microbacterium awajiense TaxID=415214 RepID=A0ABP7AE93_9MICO